ncbi:alpha/beta hydrolase family protein [Streptomyces sp. NPDC057696]|uniref:alpha/beta hydrolase family protein n=1 Tax=Streptomyces sp. NPDC057696 TaxID=3346218 RepID=UPI003698A762
MVFKAGEGLKNADFVNATPRNGTPCNATPRNGTPEPAALPARHAEPPVTRAVGEAVPPHMHRVVGSQGSGHREPVLIVQDTADTTVPAVTSTETAAALARAGTRVTYTSYEGVGHPSLPVTALDEVDAWLDARPAR